MTIQQEWALRRLRRFLTVKLLNPDADPAEAFLIERALVEVRGTCVMLGVGDEADSVLDAWRTRNAIGVG